MKKAIIAWRHLLGLCLIMWTLTAAAEPAKMEFRGTPADRKTLATYRLDQARIARYVAVIQTLNSTTKTDSALKKEVDSFAPANATNPIEQQIASFPKAFPRIAAELKKQKYAARDLILTSISIGTAGLAMAFGEPSELPDWIPADNVRLVKENSALLKSTFAK